MQENSTDPHPLGNLAYDWVTLVQNKAQALMAYDQYIKDAEAAGSAECAAFFRKVHDTDKAQLAEAKQHLVKVLQGKMGGQNLPGPLHEVRMPVGLGATGRFPSQQQWQ